MTIKMKAVIKVITQTIFIDLLKFKVFHGIMAPFQRNSMIGKKLVKSNINTTIKYEGCYQGYQKYYPYQPTKFLISTYWVEL